MLALMLALSSSAADPAAVSPGPRRHAWSNHFRLWSRINEDARDLSIGHDLVISPDDVNELLVEREADSWHLVDGDPGAFILDDVDVEVDAEGTWRSSKGDRGEGTVWIAGNEAQILVFDNTGLHVFVKQAVGITVTTQGLVSSYDIDYHVNSASFDFDGLLGDPSRWRFVSYADDLRAEQQPHTLIALPWDGQDIDEGRPGYSLFFYSPERGEVDVLAARVRIGGEPPPRANSSPGSTVFTRIPAVAAPTVSSWSAQLSVDAAAQVGGLIELDRPRPDALAGVTARIQLDRVVLEGVAHTAGADGLIAWKPNQTWLLGARAGAFLDTGHATAVLGFTSGPGQRGRWRLDGELGIGTAGSARGRLARIVRTGRRWDVTVGVHGWALDVDWIVDKNPRFPVYGGVFVGTTRSGWTL